MTDNKLTASRRRFIGMTGAGIIGASVFFERGVFAEQLAQTPAQVEGPFYPNKMPLDTDNDLLIINDSITPAVGTITHLSGRILDRRGDPIRNAVVEIWQVDNNAAYLHTGSVNADKRDKNFQGFGRFMTGSSGDYYFRTVKPVVYPGRLAPHVHFAVKVKGQDRFTTQCYIKGHAGNEVDEVFKRTTDPKLRQLLMADFVPVKNSSVGEVAASFNIVLGFTAQA